MPRSVQLRLRLTPDEMGAIRDAARRATLTPSGYAAEAAIAAALHLDGPSLAPWREALTELMLARSQLQRVGVNLNQVVRTMHVTEREPDWLARGVDLVSQAVLRLDAVSEHVSRLARREISILPCPLEISHRQPGQQCRYQATSGDLGT